jgi:uncharacterized protein (TIGR00106 family)
VGVAYFLLLSTITITCFITIPFPLCSPSTNSCRLFPMVIAEITVVPLGTGNPSLSRFVAEAVKALEDSGIRYTLTPMGTVLEGTLEEVLEAVRMLHRLPFNKGAERVSTRLVIDERRDKDATAAGKIKSVEERLKKGDS